MFFCFIYRYGLRLNEALQIKLKDVTPVEIEIRRLKGGQGRHYPIAKDDSKLLSCLLKKQALLKNSDYNSYFFITSHSVADPMSEAMGKKLHRKYCVISGINDEKRNNMYAEIAPPEWRRLSKDTIESVFEIY